MAEAVDSSTPTAGKHNYSCYTTQNIQKVETFNKYPESRIAEEEIEHLYLTFDAMDFRAKEGG